VADKEEKQEVTQNNEP